MQAAHPDRVAPAALVERADLERRLVPVVELDVLGRRRVVDAGRLPGRTTQQSVPPFLKNPYTESEVYESCV
jgi:hypothetical protein